MFVFEVLFNLAAIVTFSLLANVPTTFAKP